MARREVMLFENVDVHADQRTIRAPIQVPRLPEDFGRATLNMRIACPTGGRCDAWDRIGHFSIVDPSGVAHEIVRFATPYGRPARPWSFDISEYISLLSNRSIARVFIDTWVKKNHRAGDGWSVSASIAYMAGDSNYAVGALISLFNAEQALYGVPGERNLTARFIMPANSAGIVVVATITGHGQGGMFKMAEFFANYHTIELRGSRYLNRSQSVIFNKRCDRAGWCPGESVSHWQFKVPAQFLPGEEVEARWWAPKFTNQLLPWQVYDGNQVTVPYYLISVRLFSLVSSRVNQLSLKRRLQIGGAIDRGGFDIATDALSEAASILAAPLFLLAVTVSLVLMANYFFSSGERGIRLRDNSVMRFFRLGKDQLQAEFGRLLGRAEEDHVRKRV